MTDAALLAHMSRLPHARASFKQLVKELGAKGVSRVELESVLDRLEGDGRIVEVRTGHYAVSSLSREYAVGRLSVHRDGYGFLVADRPIEGVAGDIFIPPSSVERAMHGDRIVARISRVAPDGKADGEIVRVLKRAHVTVVGQFRIARHGCFVVPEDDRIRQWIEIPEGLEIPPPRPASPDRIGVKPVEVSSVRELNGLIVNAELLAFPDSEEGAVGCVIEILGDPDDFGIDVEIIIRKHHLPHEFPPEALEEAAAVPVAIEAAELAGRRDFRDMPIVTIDGETARDFDDAVWVDRLPNGHFALHVHIADVSHYVRPGSPIDEEARLRGTSVYFPDRAVPMLPYELSTNICSLRPKEDRLVLSALMEIDHQGDVVATEFVRGVIRSVERMTYTDVHALLEGDEALRQRYQYLSGSFELMRELALILNRKRVKRGSIDFDLPEPLIEFDEWGRMTGVSRSPRNIAHRLIEEFMLTANEAVAGYLESREIPSVFRIHEVPDPKRVMEFEEVAAQFAYTLGVGPIPVRRVSYSQKRGDGRPVRKQVTLPDASIHISSRHYQRLVAKLEGKPEERILSYLMLRSLKQARYSTDNQGHFALAASTYTHFTSPIRRYPDLVVHRQLKAVMDGRTTAGEAELQSICEDCSHSERRAADAERELVDWKKAKFMEGRVGDEFSAMVISTSKYGLFVELDDLFVEGLVPVDLLPGDQYYYNENVRKLIGARTRREFAIGIRVNVCLDRVDPIDRKLQFSLMEPEVRRREKTKKRRS
ncbi:MAG: ribonuclease R family protein [Bryobacteraceae bacterium]